MRGMILAAGLGERLRPHTAQAAKPALSFLNLPLLCYPWFHLQRLGVQSLTINTHHLPDSIKAASAALGCPQILFTHESPLILGSGGGIKNAQAHLLGDGNFLVANGDEVLLATDGLTPLWNRQLKNKNLATLLVCEHPDVGSRFGGVWCNPDGRVVGFGKTAPAPQLRGLHFTGFMVLSDRVFSYLPADRASNILYDGLVAGLANGERVEVEMTEPFWFESGSEADFLTASRECLEHLFSGDVPGRFLEQLMLHFGRILFPKSPSLMVGKDCVIDPSARIEGPCLLGNRVQVGAKVVIKGFAVIGDDSSVGESCIVDSSVIGRNQKVSARTEMANSLRLF